MIYSEQYGETVTAEQDQEFCKVRSPASVESMGSNPCISVAVYSNQLKMAWMVHMSRHPDNTDELHEMLSDVSEETGGGGMTKSLIIGGDGNYTLNKEFEDVIISSINHFIPHTCICNKLSDNIENINLLFVEEDSLWSPKFI